MKISLSDRTLDALAQVISGGSFNDGKPSIGLYRSGLQLQEFFKEFRGAEVDLSSYSRLPATKQALLLIALMDHQPDLKRVVEKAADPRDFFDDPERHQAVMEYLNGFLAYDG